ncbi:MAG: hypothetical protein OXU86_07440 [Thaumarchaeota archaeon]|nr:hypothetical protein [Nitrososphaerota archaeon]MDD9826582.1 hypothetical protein [Nitrososphaerota archaeon]
MRASDRLPYMAAMQQQVTILVAMCQHIDIKALIFLSFVAIVLFVYAYGPFGNPVVLVLGIGFALAYPIRIGVDMLASKPLHAGGVDLDVPVLFGADEEKELAAQRRMAMAHKRAILHNSKILKKKHKQSTDLVITSLMLFGYLMGMTVAFMAIAPSGA